MWYVLARMMSPIVDWGLRQSEPAGYARQGAAVLPQQVFMRQMYWLQGAALQGSPSAVAAWLGSQQSCHGLRGSLALGVCLHVCC